MAAIGVGGSVCAPALAATSPSTTPPRPNFAGTYNGQINQVQPKPYTGHIHFVVSHGKLTGLKFTAGTLCGVVWVVDKDHNLPTFAVAIAPNGAFSYSGTVAGRKIRLKGTFKGNKAQGTFFTAFPSPFGASACTMGQGAPFSVTRST